MIKKITNYLNEDYNRKTFIFTLISILICLAYAVYNGYIGYYHQSIWNGSICVYYLLLLLIKTLLVIENILDTNSNRKKVVIMISYILLFLITISMIAPAVLLIYNKRSSSLGLIPAIAMAAYTTYSITMAFINVNKAQNHDNYYIKLIRLINVVSAMMSVLVLQNTLILATDGYNDDMKLLSFYTSFGIIVAVVVIISINLYR